MNETNCKTEGIAKITAAESILNFTSQVSDRAEKVAELVRSRLSTISRLEPPKDVPNAPSPDHPEYFLALHCHLARLEGHLMNIEETISRVEV